MNHQCPVSITLAYNSYYWPTSANFCVHNYMTNQLHDNQISPKNHEKHAQYARDSNPGHWR